MTMLAQRTTHVIQGDHQVSDEADIVMVTVLGSCVAACLYDPVRRIGGMNHFLLPDAPGGRDINHASAAMERLINSLLKRDARRERLIAKLFGGARMMKGLPDIGRRNGEAAVTFLRGEGIPVEAQSLGGDRARRIRFWPVSGRAQQLLLVEAIEQVGPPVAPPPPNGSIELF